MKVDMGQMDLIKREFAVARLVNEVRLQEIANEAGMHRDTVSKVIRFPEYARINQLLAVARVLNVPIQISLQDN